MRYVVIWRERPTGSDAEYETAQQRVREAFSASRMPRSLTFHHVVARLGLGGYAVVETDEPADLQYLRDAYEPVSFTVAPVLDGMPALAARTRGVG